MNESQVASFWETHPCGDHQVGGLKDDYLDFFDRYDAFRYKKEGHILGCLDGIDWQDKDVLEIGLGQGADSEQIIRRGGRWSGLDLTNEAVERTSMRMALRELPYGAVKQGSILEAPYEDNSFDIIFSLADKLGVQFAFPTQTVHLYKEEHTPYETKHDTPQSMTERRSMINGIRAAQQLVKDQPWQNNTPGPVTFQTGPTDIKIDEHGNPVIEKEKED